jgi:hypothetical protein
MRVADALQIRMLAAALGKPASSRISVEGCVRLEGVGYLQLQPTPEIFASTSSQA